MKERRCSQRSLRAASRFRELDLPRQVEPSNKNRHYRSEDHTLIGYLALVRADSQASAGEAQGSGVADSPATRRAPRCWRSWRACSAMMIKQLVQRAGEEQLAEVQKR